MRDYKSSQAGFTLIELMIVVVIIGILAALAIPRFMDSSTKTKQSEAKIILKQIVTLQLVYRVDSPTNDYYSSGATASAGNPMAFVELGLEIPPNARYSFTIADMGLGYLATATGDVDDDGVDDIWTIDETGQMQNTQNDVIL